MHCLIFFRGSFVLIAALVWGFLSCDGSSLDNILQDVGALISNYSFAMDMSVPQDKALAETIPASFSKRLEDLQNAINSERKHDILSQLLVAAVKGVLKAQSNVMKDRLAKQDKMTRPRDVLRSFRWITKLLELLLDNRVFTPLELKTALPALQLSVEVQLTTAAQLLLSSIEKVGESYKEAIARLIAMATAVQSSDMLAVLLADFRNADTPVLAQLLLKHSKMADKSAYEVALEQCAYLSPSVQLWSGYEDERCVPDCSAVDWLLGTTASLSVSSEASQNTEQTFDELCMLVRYGRVELSSPISAMLIKPRGRGGDSPHLDSGWRQGTFLFSMNSDADMCQVPRLDVSDLSDDAFHRLVRLSLPFVITNTGIYAKLVSQFSRESLMKSLGSVDLLVGNIPYADVFGEANGVASGTEFAAYLDRQWHVYKQSVEKWRQGLFFDRQAPLYVFDEQVIGANLNQTDDLFSLPGLFKMWTNRLYQFIWGPPGSGSPVHFHCPAVNLVVFGRKRWWLSPPGSAYYSKTHPVLEWQEKTSQRVLHCVQQAGEMVFVPRHWAHSTVNVDETVGLAVEFDTGNC